MDGRDNETYYRLLKEMLQTFVREDIYDYEEVKVHFKDIAEHYHLTKATAEFYRSQSHERIGDGDHYVGYENGEESKVLLTIRVVTQTTAVAIGTVYGAIDREYTDEEIKQLELFLRTILFFVSRKKIQNALERIAYYDEYGYPNIRSFMRNIDNSYKEEGIYGYTAICYDIRHLALINREIGHDNGSKVMRMVFEMMQAMVGENGIVCRFNGDTFFAKFKNEYLDSILSILKGTSITYDGETQRKVFVSASVGVYVIPKNYKMGSSADIVDKILPAVNAAKAEATGVVYYTDKVIQDREDQMSMHRLFPIALSNHEFKVFYQPKIDVATGKISGAEALCRWFRDGKIVPPGEFIPILEQNADICQLDFYMLDQVCKDIKRWSETGRNVVRVSVNFSRKHLLDPYFMDKILKIIKDNGISYEYVEVELTETTTDVEFLDLKRIVGGLQKEGICTSVDDFGMGYSSLNLIREIPWDVLKIDKCFLPAEGETYNEITSTMFKHIISMAKDIGLECITEGVETKDQVEILRQNGCQFAQGFFFDKPLPVEEFEKRLEKGFYEIS